MGDVSDENRPMVSFDVTVHVGDKCPVDYHVDETATTFYFGEVGTSATVVFADSALLALAEVTRRAVDAGLSMRDASYPAKCRPAADPPDTMWSHPPVWIDAGATVADGCSISLEVDGDVARIIVLDDTTLCFTFWRRALLEFALLVSDAACVLRHRHTRKVAS